MLHKLTVSLVLVGLMVGSFVFAVPQASADASFDGFLVWETGDISHPYDEYAIIAEAGETIIISMECVGTDDAFDPMLVVRSEDGVELDSNDDSGHSGSCLWGYESQIIFVVPQTGTYVIHATSNDAYYASPQEDEPGDFWGTGAYTLSIVGNFTLVNNPTTTGGINDGRLCRWSNYAVYTSSSRIDVYGIYQRKGYFVLRVTADELAAVPGTEGVNTLIASSDDGAVQVYRLGTSNLYQVHAGLDFVRFSGLPARGVFCGTVVLPQ